MNLAEPRESEIHEQVKRIVTSGVFSGSERLCRFLTWTVEQTLQGQAQKIKSYTVGLEVFDRRENFDPRIDSIVRTEAVRLRRKLAEYYKSDGASDPILISFEPGSYAPSFRLRPTDHSTVVRTRPGGRRGIAVVPFVNLTGDPQQEHFCRGIGASIQEHLMARDLTVFSVHLAPVDWFSCDFVQLARDLGVEKIVTGGIREERRAWSAFTCE